MHVVVQRTALVMGLSLALSAGLSACRAQQNDAQASQPAAKTSATQQVTSQLGSVGVTTIASGLEHPWAVALLPDGSFLVTERPGRLRRVSADGKVSAPMSGVPAVWAEGQGGLLDVVLAPDFASSRRIYLSYSEPGPEGSAGTAVSIATLGDTSLTDVRRVYQQQPKLVGPNHFGSRIVFDGKGHMFISQGERNDRPTSQKLDMLQGKLVRLNLDGSVPADNPFVGRKDARPEIWSYGHRNMQSLALDPRTGKVWEAEHGPRGGDEINLPEPGKNYGWPIITHGINYSGLKIPEAVGTAAPGHGAALPRLGKVARAFRHGVLHRACPFEMERQPVPRRTGRRQPDPPEPGRRSHHRRGAAAEGTGQAYPRRARRHRWQGLRADRRERRPVAAPGRSRQLRHAT